MQIDVVFCLPLGSLVVSGKEQNILRTIYYIHL